MIVLILFVSLFAAPAAAEGTNEGGTAQKQKLTVTGFDAAEIGYMLDENERTYSEYNAGTELHVSSKEKIAHITVRFFDKAVEFRLSANGTSVDCGKELYLHGYVNVADAVGAAEDIVLTFGDKANVAEFAAYGVGTLPDDVQVWNPPLDRADLVMYSSHADDEQLFFSGVLPDSVAKGAAVEVVYFCDHSGESMRPHEQLDGLWAVGVRNYPVFGIFPDLYSESLEGAYYAYGAQGYGEEDFMAWQVENIRRFRPQVLVGHDVNGEYGHGTHLLNSETLQKAVIAAADSTQYPGSAEEYGVWDTPKTYLHLYPENAIVLDFDTPLDYFGGKTAYEVSCEGFSFHKSQHWTWFYNWMYGPEGARYTAASQITSYSPCNWGLWRTTVGTDTTPDLFEHIEFYPKPEPEQPEETAPVEPEETTRAEQDETTPAEPEETTAAAADETAPKKGISGGTVVLIFVSVALVALVGYVYFRVKANKRRLEEEQKRRRAERMRRAAQMHRRAEQLRFRAEQMRYSAEQTRNPEQMHLAERMLYDSDRMHRRAEQIRRGAGQTRSMPRPQMPTEQMRRTPYPQMPPEQMRRRRQ